MPFKNYVTYKIKFFIKFLYKVVTYKFCYYINNVPYKFCFVLYKNVLIKNVRINNVTVSHHPGWYTLLLQKGEHTQMTEN